MTRLIPETTIDGRYRVLSLLGSGGMGQVYEALDLQLDRVVAVKMLTVSGSDELGERFKREAFALSKITHRNIVRIYAFGISSDLTSYLVMEKLDGAALSQILVTQGMQTAEFALRTALAVAEALSEAHGIGIIHRDLKPSNIVITEDGTAKVIDFGLCTVADLSGAASQSLTKDGFTVGSLQYMSPELCRGLPVSASSDIYALGVVLYEMITGKLLVEGVETTELLAKQMNQPVPSLAKDYPFLPHADKLDALLKRCLAKDSRDRFESAAALSFELRTLLENVGESETQNPVQPRHRKKFRSRAISFSALVVVGGLAIAWCAQTFLSKKPSEPVVQYKISAHDAIEQASGLIRRASDLRHSGKQQERLERSNLTKEANNLLKYSESLLQGTTGNSDVPYLYWHFARLRECEGKESEAKQEFLKAIQFGKTGMNQNRYCGLLEDAEHFFEVTLNSRRNLTKLSHSAEGRSKIDSQVQYRDIISVLIEETKLRIKRRELSRAWDHLEQANWALRLAHIDEPDIINEVASLRAEVAQMSRL